MNEDGAFRARLAMRRLGQALRAAKQRRRRVRRWGVLVAIGLAALLLTIFSPPRPLLLWNASASAPVGLYAVSGAGAIRTGDMVVAWPPDVARRLGAARHYLPANVPLIKRVAAEPGDRVCALGAGIFVNGRLIAVRQAVDMRGGTLPWWWRGCLTLRRGALLLLMDHADSFDGRYFGPTQVDQLIGKAHLLWAR